MKNYGKIARAIAVFGQLGFSLVTPPVCLTLAAGWLQERFAFGAWIVLLGLALGLMTAAANALRFYRKVTAQAKKEKKQDIVFYNHE